MHKHGQKLSEKHPLSQSLPSLNRMLSFRLSFFGKGITSIDKLDSVPPHILSSIKQLDLSHNAIAKLDNIKQFPNVQILNLAHNFINDGKQILKLNKLSKLRMVMVKGNPFWKSGEGKIEAIKFLIPYQTDIQILSYQLQSFLQEAVKYFTEMQVKKQHLTKLQSHIQMITQLNIEFGLQVKGETYQRVVNKLLEDKISQISSNYRREVIQRIINPNIDDLPNLETKQDLQRWLQEKIQLYSFSESKQLEDLTRTLLNKQQILTHVKQMKREKHKQGSFRYFTKNGRNSPLKSMSRGKSIKKNSPSKQFYKTSQSFLTQQNQNILISEFSTKRHHQTQEKFESYYQTMLTKYNPVYQLLYSPIHSLKNKQKDLLIQTLSVHLKEKSYAAFKGEKIKDQFQQLSLKYAEKEKQMKQSQQKFYEYKMAMNEKAAFLEASLKQRQDQLRQMRQQRKALNEERAKLQKRVSFLEQDVSQRKLKEIRQQSDIEKNRMCDEMFQIIQNKREERGKRMALSRLTKKSLHFFRLKKIQEVNKKSQESQLLLLSFYGLKSEAINRKKSKEIEKILIKKRIIEIFENAKCITHLQKSKSTIKKVIKEATILKLWSNFSKLKSWTAQRTMKINQFNQRVCMRIERQLFSVWRSEVKQKKQKNQQSKADEFYKYHLQLRAIKNWLVYLKLPIYQGIEVAARSKVKQIQKFFRQIKSGAQRGKKMEENFLTFIVFLNQTWRANNFFRFKKYSILSSQVRKSKEENLLSYLKSTYFHDFVTLSNSEKNRRHIRKFNEQKIASIRKRGVFRKFSSFQYLKLVRESRLFKIFQRYRKFSIGQSLRDSIKQFVIQDRSKKRDIQSFLLILRGKLKRKGELKIKTAEVLVKTLKFRQSNQFRLKREFMRHLASPKIQKRKLIEFLGKKYFKITMKHFHQWKIQILRNKIQYFKGKLTQFGPEIEEISKRQKATFQEKLVLMSIIDSKQKTIKQYLKQLEQAQYTIKTKQEKYKKLKDFLHDSGDDVTVIGSKVFPSLTPQSLVPERDYQNFFSDQKDYFETFRRF